MTVVAAVMVAVLLCITGAGVYLGAVVVARHRAQAAADLAALAAATWLPAGVGAACARATLVGREMRVDTVQCERQGLDIVVTTRVAITWGRVVAGAAWAAARAGPETSGAAGGGVSDGLCKSWKRKDLRTWRAWM